MWEGPAHCEWCHYRKGCWASHGEQAGNSIPLWLCFSFVPCAFFLASFHDRLWVTRWNKPFSPWVAFGLLSQQQKANKDIHATNLPDTKDTRSSICSLNYMGSIWERWNSLHLDLQFTVAENGECKVLIGHLDLRTVWFTSPLLVWYFAFQMSKIQNSFYVLDIKTLSGVQLAKVFILMVFVFAMQKLSDYFVIPLDVSFCHYFMCYSSSFQTLLTFACIIKCLPIFSSSSFKVSGLTLFEPSWIHFFVYLFVLQSQR